MTQQTFFIIQIVADVALCAAFIFFIFKINEESRRKRTGIDPYTLTEFKKLIADSQETTANLVASLEEGKKALRDLSRVLDEKELRLKKAMESPEPPAAERAAPRDLPDGRPRERNYEEALMLARRGMSVREISKKLALPEGEITLILDIDRRRSEVSRC